MKYCTKCGKEMSLTDKFCVGCGNLLKENEKLNSKNGINSTKILVVLFLFMLIFSIVLLSTNKSDNSFKPNKPSAISFVKDIFNSKTCDEFFSSFNGEIIIEIKEGMTLSDDAEECNRELVKELNGLNNALDFFKQCKELNKDDLNFDYIEFESTKTMPAYSDIVLCSSESMEGMYFFLNYNELENNYKIVNVGMDNKEKVIAERKAEEIKNKEIELRKNPTDSVALAEKNKLETVAVLELAEKNKKAAASSAVAREFAMKGSFITELGIGLELYIQGETYFNTAINYANNGRGMESMSQALLAMTSFDSAHKIIYDINSRYKDLPSNYHVAANDLFCAIKNSIDGLYIFSTSDGIEYQKDLIQIKSYRDTARSCIIRYATFYETL